MAEEDGSDTPGEVRVAFAIEVPDAGAFHAAKVRRPGLRIEEVGAFGEKAGAAGDFRFGFFPELGA